MIAWRLHHAVETASTNLDARAGLPGDVYTADYQTAGRGRLDHRWLSPPGTNLMMSAVLGVADLPPEQIATLPLVVGLAVVRAVARFLPAPARPLLKWPNDVLVDGRKLAGILCERQNDGVIAGIGVNVGQRAFPTEIAATATSLSCLAATSVSCATVRTAILEELAELHDRWTGGGFAAVYSEIAAIDWLKGRNLLVRQTDDDAEPIGGTCGGIAPDGSLDVGGVKVYAGEAHIIR